MEKIKNNITELVFIIDRSGSMSGLEGDTIGSFNSLIEKQKKVDGKCYVSTVLFDHEQKVIHDRAELDNIKPLTDKDYYARGCTALVDAIGLSVRHIANIHKYARREDVPQRTMFIIITDGYENASRIFTVDRVRDMVEYEKKNYGWEFIFIGTNDVFETAENFGIGRERAATYNADSVGTQVAYDTFNDLVTYFRNDSQLAPDWNRKITLDHESRK